MSDRTLPFAQRASAATKNLPQRLVTASDDKLPYRLHRGALTSEVASPLNAFIVDVMFMRQLCTDLIDNHARLTAVSHDAPRE